MKVMPRALKSLQRLKACLDFKAFLGDFNVNNARSVFGSPENTALSIDFDVGH